jgi:hypothetical protein
MAMSFETKNIAVEEVSSRNEILSGSIEKIKNELFNTRRNIAVIESEKFELEKETL